MVLLKLTMSMTAIIFDEKTVGLFLMAAVKTLVL